MYSLEDLEKCTKKDLLLIAKKYRISYAQKYKKKDLIIKIQEKQDFSTEKIQPIFVNNKKYTKIIHISDIHIRPLTRHEEFEEVFEKLYSFLENTKEYNNNRIIAITGDLLQEKDNLKPETLLVCRKFLKKCALYGSVIVIAGNHDMLENNTNRLDNISAIVDDLRIHYCIDSGSYQFGNLIISVSSLVDKKFIQSYQVETNNLTHICLYHGSIIGSTTDLGHTIQDIEGSTRFRKISDFDGFDMVLLGDIHKYQYIKPHIAYSGSMIQQNFGETIENHGFLEWDIEKKNSIFHTLPNDYGFITIECNDNIYHIPDNIPLKPYIRIITKNSTISTIEKIKKDLSVYNVQSFSIKEKYDSEITEYKEDMVYHENDIHMLEKEMDLLHYTDIEKESIFSIHSSIKETIQNTCSFQMNHCQWKIEILHFKNAFIYGGNEMKTIDFRNLVGITGIFGPNASGKTSIINIILFLLYGNTGNKIIHVLHKKEKDYYIEGEFLFGTERYKIIRSGTIRKGNKLNHILSVFLWKDTWIKQDLENNTKTNQYLQEKIGTYDNFLLTNMYTNSSLKSLLHYTNSEKYKALRTLFAIDIYEYYEKEAKKKIQEYTNTIQKIDSSIEGLEYTIPNIDSIDSLYEKEKIHKNTLYHISQKKDSIIKKVQQLEKIIETCKTSMIECETIDFSEVYERLQKYTNIGEYKDIEELKNTLYFYIKQDIPKAPYFEGNLEEYKKQYDSIESEYNISIRKYAEYKKTLEILYEKQIELQKKIIPIVTYIDYTDEIKKYNTKEILYTDDELDELSLYITKYKEEYKPSNTELPKDFSYSKNHKKLEKMKYILEEMKISLEKYNIVYNKDICNKDICNKDICNKDICNIFIDCETLEEIDTLYYQKNIYYKKEKKEISSKRNTIYLEDIPIIQEIRSCIKDTRSISYEYLETLVKKIVEYDNIDKLVQYKNTQEIEKHIENNRILDEKIIMLENMYKIAYKEYYTKKHLLYNKKYKKYKKYEDIFLYNSYNRYNDIIKYKKYKEMLAKQEEFEQYKKVEKEQLYYRKEQDTLEKECNILKQQIANIEEYNKKMLQDKENIFIKIEKIQSYQTYSENQKKIQEIQEDIEKQEIRISYIADKELYEKKEEYEKIYSKNKELQKTIQDFTNTLIQYKKELIDIENKYNNTKTFLIEISFSIKNILEKQEDKRKIVDHITKLQNNRKDIQYDIELYTKYLLLVHKNGIPKKCIHTKISYIQDYMNICLQNVVDFTTSIEVENNNIQFVFHKNSICLDFEQLSGYERFIVHIACKISLQKYSFTSKSTLFVIDEGLDVIDNNNIPKLQYILQTIKKTYNHILLLSHYTTICSIVDNVY